MAKQLSVQMNESFRSTRGLGMRLENFALGEEHCFCIAKSGGVRLFRRVAGKWMDASLKDLPLRCGANGEIYRAA